MKSYQRLTAAVTAIVANSLLASCIVISPGIPGGGITPIDGPGDDVDDPQKVWEYSVDSIQVYQLPEKKSKKVYWDAPGAWVSEFDRRFPDVYFKGTSDGRTIFKTPTITDHEPSGYTTIEVPRNSERLDDTPVIHFGFYDKDRKNDDEMGGYKVRVPKPKGGSSRASKTVKYKNSNGDVNFKVNFTYRQVNP